MFVFREAAGSFAPFLLLAGLPLLAAPAESCVTYADRARAVHDVRNIPGVRGAAASGDVFYLARHESFEIHDASDPAAPVLLGSTPIGRGAENVGLDGDLAFIPVRVTSPVPE